MSKEVGVPTAASEPDARKARGLKVWEKGEIFRPGKTRRDVESGAYANHLRNREERRQENKRQAGKK